ncbi:MAG: VanZ family protein [Planctomycetes bacterium]|nr:VanZ family protein [Planctomycetota bacterium]
MRILSWIADVVRRAPRLIAVIAFLAWTGLIFFLSSQPPLDPDARSSVLRSWLMNLRHAPAFGMFALLFLWATARSKQRIAADGKRVAWAIFAVLLYGIFDERHQFYTPGRDASVSDILTNLAGGWTCAALMRAIEDGAPGARVLRLFLIGVLWCAITAGIATLLPEQWPDLTWL